MPTYIATPGFVGQLTVNDGISRPLRVSSSDIKATQTQDYPTPISNKYDKSVYTLGPIEVGGSLAFPVAHEAFAFGATSASYFFDKAYNKDVNGRIAEIRDITLRYYGGQAYKYSACYIDSYDFSVAQGDALNISCGIIAKRRDEVNKIKLPFSTRNVRVVAWNDVFLSVVAGPIVLNAIRSFKFSIANNSKRDFSLAGRLTNSDYDSTRSDAIYGLYALDVITTKRDLTGSFEFSGVDKNLARYSYSNKDRCYEEVVIGFGFNSPCVGFAKSFTGAVFQIEEVALSNELVVSNVGYRILLGGRQ